MDKPDSSNNQQEQNRVDLTENCKNQCLLYLLNELAPDQLILFEERLGKSDVLADELQRQAEMIVTLSELSTPPEMISRPIISTTAQDAQSRSQKLLVRGFAIAVAVCIAGFVFRTWWPATKTPQGSESSKNKFAGSIIDGDSNLTPVSESALIARAWASQVDDPDFTITPNAPLTRTDVQAIASDKNELESQPEATDVNSDDSFSWMFTAAFEIHEMETNDG